MQVHPKHAIWKNEPKLAPTPIVCCCEQREVNPFLGKVMARMPAPVVFLAFPFETVWTQARAGKLQIGDPAPDFSLIKLDKSEHVQLSTLNKQQPVVLVFGSYT